MSFTLLLFITISLGLIGGLMAGLLGIGGGVIIVPVLFSLFSEMQLDANVAMPMALATTLGVIVLTTAGAALSHKRIGNLRWLIVRRYIVWMMLGAFVASQIAGRMNAEWWLWIFPIFLLYVAARLSGLIPQKIQIYAPLHKWQQYIGAFLFGNLAIFLGLSGSVLLVPHFMQRHHLTMAQAVGTATACGMGTAFVGMLGYMLYAAPVHDLPGGNIGYVYWPAVLVMGISGLFAAPLGAKLAKKVPELWLKRLFSTLLVIIACSMWFGN